MNRVERLGSERYVLLTTFRKDGRAVPTPVWVARDGAELVAWTVTTSGKAKRIRRSGEVTVAPCDARGRALGDAVAGRATIADAAGTERIRRLLKQKYGLIGWITINGSRLRRGETGTVGIRIRIVD
ncbi:MAG TPA: PPOX class F420-dependent oxidoreductase [Micromonosporaceae bacterium]|nr:PPOX class F420-dependent oxidoreductase [Micromonosporaceae bacterium]